MRSLLISCMVIFMMAGMTFGEDFFVKPGGTGDGSTYALAMNLSTAIAKGDYNTAGGDRIILAPGKYISTGGTPDFDDNLNFDFQGTGPGYLEVIGDRSGYVTSTAPTSGVAHATVEADAITSYGGGAFLGKVIIDASGLNTLSLQNRIFGINGTDSYIKISNLEITNAVNLSWWAGGSGYVGAGAMWIYGGAHHITVEHCIISNCTGGGISIGDDSHDITIFNCLVYNTGFKYYDAGVNITGWYRGGSGGITAQADTGASEYPDRILIKNCTSVMVYNRGFSLSDCTNSMLMNCVGFQPDWVDVTDVLYLDYNSYQKTIQVQTGAAQVNHVGTDTGFVNNVAFGNQQYSISNTGPYVWWGDNTAADGYNPGDEMPGIISQNLYWHEHGGCSQLFELDMFDNATGGIPHADMDFYLFAIGTAEFGNNPNIAMHDFVEGDFRLFIDSYLEYGGGTNGISADGSPVNGGVGSARILGLSTRTSFKEDPLGVAAGTFILDGDPSDYSEECLIRELDRALSNSATGGWWNRTNDPLLEVVWDADHNVAGAGGYVDSEADYSDPDVVNMGYHWLPLDAAGYSVVDTDLDGMPDAWETGFGLAPLDPTDADLDGDGDGYSNVQEYQLSQNPTVYNVPDVDSDGLDDRWEQYYSPDRDGDDLTITAAELDDFSGATGADLDYDSDTLTDQEEHDFAADTGNPAPFNPGATIAAGDDAGTDPNPTVADTDQDGLLDGYETATGGAGAWVLGTMTSATDTGSNPVLEDSDVDGMPDGWEAGVILSFSGAGDDGIIGNGDDIDPWLDPNTDDSTVDTDNDGYDNITEYGDMTDPTDNSKHYADIDGDNIDDNWELLYAADETVLGEDFTAGAAQVQDVDGDGLTDWEEYELFKNFGLAVDPTDADTDDDGLDDGVESNTGTFVSFTEGTPDTGDTGTNPVLADSDGDGMNDGWEATYKDILGGGGGFDPNVDDTGNFEYDPSADPDSDTWSNLTESTLGGAPDVSNLVASSGSGGGGCMPAAGGSLLLALAAAFALRRRD